jgi:hypothetical protein
MAEYPFKVQEPANKLHITPGITKNFLLSTRQFAAANYITTFDKEEVNIYDANGIIIAVTRRAILQGWWDAATRLWHIPLVAVVRNINTDNVIVNRPPIKFLPKCPPPTDKIHNVNELNTQPELVCCYHAVDSPQNPPGSRPSGTSSLPHGQVSQWMPSSTTTQILKRHQRGMAERHQAGYGQPSRLHQHWTTVMILLTPTL